MNSPENFNTANIKLSLDARPLLAQGIHPLEQVQQEQLQYLQAVQVVLVHFL